MPVFRNSGQCVTVGSDDLLKEPERVLYLAVGDLLFSIRNPRRDGSVLIEHSGWQLSHRGANAKTSHDNPDHEMSSRNPAHDSRSCVPSVNTISPITRLAGMTTSGMWNSSCHTTNTGNVASTMN